MSEAVTRWWWLRHAPVPDPEGRIVGQLDPAADTSETACFQALANRLPRNPLVVQSGFLRTGQTLAALEATGLVLAPALVQPAFAEQHFGAWEGHSWAELSAAQDPDLAPFWTDPAHMAPPGGECFADMVMRVAPAVRALSDEAHDRDVLAVAHAGTIRAALAIALGIDAAKALSFVVQPLSLTRIDVFASGGYRVLDVNWLPE